MNRKTDSGAGEKILAASTLVAVEDLYLPYRPKREDTASIAKEKGLEPLANLVLMLADKDAASERGGALYLREEKGVLTGRRP